ncbi:MAG: VWA domain-containing protein [Methyloprofundus sp.]|nr:VWA domain-containing protein [Methyloprofundus sp.]MDT8424492.1 VWA domain-containing protein [Methyloprofundus sp.]
MNFSDFHLIRPYWLLAFLALIVFVFLTVKHKLRQGNWQSVCDPELLPFVLQEQELKHSRAPLITSSLAATLAIIALAGPTWQRVPTPVFRNAAALVIALDLSRSMDAADIKPSRLDRARYKIADLLKKRKDGQTALLVYAGAAFTVTPLTDDAETINNQLSALTTDIMPAQGSHSDLAINKAVELFKNAGLQQGQILLITDDEQIETAFAQTELPDNFQLSILGVGTAEGAPVTLTQGGFLTDASGNIVLPKLNAPALQKVAQAGGGIYQQITDNSADIETLSRHFEQAAKRGEALENNLLLENWLEAGVWLLLPLLLFASLSFRRGLLSLLFILLLPFPKESSALEWQDLWQTKEQQAQQSYLRGDYKEAAEKFTDPAWQAAAQYKANKPLTEKEALAPATTATGFYNQGNVLAKSGQLEKAINAYEQALKLNPDNEDAQYNKELVEKALEQQKQQQQNQEKDKDSKQDQENNDQSEPEQQKDQQGEQSDPDAEQQDNKDPEQQTAEENQEPDKQDSAAEKEQQKPNETSEPEPEQAPESKQESAAEAQDSEQQQANEQWLKRIPDDPAGLLKRKFLYQYGQQKQRNNTGQQW